MSEALEPQTDKHPIVFNYTDAALDLLREQAKDIHLVALDDEVSLKKVHDMRILLRDARCAIENKRVELKKDALEYGRRIDAEAKRLTAFIEPQEVRLADEEKSVERERERQRAEVERLRQEVINRRVREVAEVGMVPNVDELGAMPEEAYARMIGQARMEKLQRDNEERMVREQREADDRARAAQQKSIEDARAEEQRLMRERQAALDLRDREQQAREQRLREAEERQAKREAEAEAADHAMEQAAAALPLGIPEELVPADPLAFTAHVNEHRVCPTCGQPWSNP